MSKIELNIGLDIKGESNFAAVITERARAIRALLRHMDEVAEMFETDVSYQREGDGLSVTEHTLVARVKSVPMDKLVSLTQLLHKLFGQDCIAVYWPDAGTGELIGPKAHEWGEFNPAFFKRFIGA